jgi:galactose mutarotase-like enzyme
MTNFHQISSDKLSVSISELGAELCSVKDLSTDYEFIWQANPAVWARHAPVLFPIVGKVYQNTLRVKEQEFSLNQHGFARDLLFEPIEIYTNLIKFMLVSSEKTKELFPYDFKFFISYEVIDETIIVSYSVLNTGNETMFFSVGAHPGFNLPNPKLNQYKIEFEVPENLDRYLLTDGLQNQQVENLGIEQKWLSLDKSLFDKDAIVLKNLKSKWLKLVQTDGRFAIQLHFEGFPFMGIWSKLGNEEFICLEPWQGIADTFGFEGEITKKEGIIGLEAGKEISFTYAIEFVAP